MDKQKVDHMEPRGSSQGEGRQTRSQCVSLSNSPGRGPGEALGEGPMQATWWPSTHCGSEKAFLEEQVLPRRAGPEGPAGRGLLQF